MRANLSPRLSRQAAAGVTIGVEIPRTPSLSRVQVFATGPAWGQFRPGPVSRLVHGIVFAPAQRKIVPAGVSPNRSGPLGGPAKPRTADRGLQVGQLLADRPRRSSPPPGAGGSEIEPFPGRWGDKEPDAQERDLADVRANGPPSVP